MSWQCSHTSFTRSTPNSGRERSLSISGPLQNECGFRDFQESNENRWKSMKIHGKSLKIHWKFTGFPQLHWFQRNVISFHMLSFLVRIIPRYIFVIISKFPSKSTVRSCGWARAVRRWCVGGAWVGACCGAVWLSSMMAVAKSYFIVVLDFI